MISFLIKSKGNSFLGNGSIKTKLTKYEAFKYIKRVRANI